jgi:hypothetical protein
MGKRGPVPRGEYSNKSRVLSTRIREDTRAALEGAAAESGRSLSQEIERRLRQSFDQDRLISAKFGTRQNYALLRLLASLFDTAPGNNESWLNDADNYNHVAHSIRVVLDALRPGDARPFAELDQMMGEWNADAAAGAVAEADASMPPNRAGNALNYIKADLGEAVVDRLKSLSETEREYGGDIAVNVKNKGKLGGEEK